MVQPKDKDTFHLPWQLIAHDPLRGRKQNEGGTDPSTHGERTSTEAANQRSGMPPTERLERSSPPN